eukprot:7608892-Alexandrium_andersonii.AAC.1
MPTLKGHHAIAYLAVLNQDGVPGAAGNHVFSERALGCAYMACTCGSDHMRDDTHTETTHEL